MTCCFVIPAWINTKRDFMAYCIRSLPVRVKEC